MKNTAVCREVNVLCDTNFPLRREVPSRNRYHIFPQYASLRTGSTSWHEREINRSKKHTQAHIQWHTCARLYTTVRNVASISQNKVSFQSGGLKRDKKNNNIRCVWCVITAAMHQQSRLGTTVLQIRGRFGEKSSQSTEWGQKKKKIPEFCAWQQNHNQVFTRSNILFCIVVGGGAQLGLYRSPDGTEVRLLPWLHFSSELK